MNSNQHGKRPPMIIIAAPSGAGKNSFVDRLLADFTMLFDTTTYTTRSMRKGESEGKPYHFVSRERFRQMVAENFFVEWATVHDNLYGTPHYQLQNAWADNKVVVMDVDVQGAMTFKTKYPSAVSLFILPPSIEELRRRILKRDGQPPADLELRLKNARDEINQASLFDYQIINDDFEASYLECKNLVARLLSAL